MGGGPDINYPDQPSYGEGMADALKAQVELLTGTGDFASTGSLESLLPLEESIRKKTAQTDTDILKQTMLGSTSGGEEQEVTYDDQGRLVKGFRDAPSYTIKTTNVDEKGQPVPNGFNPEGYNKIRMEVVKPNGEVAQTVEQVQIGDVGGGRDVYVNFDLDGMSKKMNAKIQGDDSLPQDFKDNIADNMEVAGNIKGTAFKPNQQTLFLQDDTGLRYSAGKGTPIYAVDSDGEIIQDASKAGMTEVRTLPKQRAGDGMIDLLGDTRNITQYETKTATQADVDAGLADEVGKQFVQKVDATDQAGFRDGEFKGLSAMAEDIQRGNLSRQREADLQDVARLEPLFGQIMEDYKPGTTSALTGAKDLIEEQKDNLLGEVGISDPTKVQSQGVQADALRAGLMTDAEEALGQGLTDREERQIAEAARARSTMMGRTFDQSGAIAEAQARVAEDNQRKMQNRGFAQSVLGQEAGIQTSDNTRSMQADQFNVASQMDAEKLRESLRQQGLLGYLDAASRVSQLENQGQLDPFQAILGRSGGGSLQAGQSVFGQAGYGLNSGPAYLNPESGLGYIQNQATNAANMYGAQVAADATKTAGIYSGIGSALGGLGGGMIAKYCWVAREVYGEHNPAWKMFRMWMFLESPTWFFKLYKNYGERFASFIADKPRLKAVIRKWMDSKIRR